MLRKNFKRHERSQNHLDNLQNYVEENIMDRDLEENYRDISAAKVKKELKKVFTEIKTNKRHFNATDFETDDYIVMKSEEALEGCFLTLRIEPKREINNIDILVRDLPDLLYQTFKELLKQKKGIKLQIFLLGSFYHILKHEEDDKSLVSKNGLITNKDQIRDIIILLLNQIKDKIDLWDNNEAYWRLREVLFIDFKLREYKPLKGSSYIPTPERISKTKSVINIKNEDQKCFKYCLLYRLYRDRLRNNPQEMYHYRTLENEFPNRLNFKGIQFPVKVHDVKKFCEQNKDISINVYLYEGGSVIPYETCCFRDKREIHVNLLLLNEGEKYHYVYIKSLSRLLPSQINNKQHKKFFCRRCLKYTDSKEKLKQHRQFCDYYFENEKAIPILPDKSDCKLRFRNIKNKIPASLIYYSDFEAVLKKLPNERWQSKHECCSYSFHALGQNEFYKNFQIYTGKSANDTMNHYINTLKSEAIKLDTDLKDRLERFKRPNLTNEEQLKFNDAKICHFCKKLFTEGDIKVRDHCHITGKFRGAAHQLCNLNVRTSLDVKVAFHNGSNYDFKFIVKKLYKICKEIQAIPFTDEKFLTFKINIPGTKISFTFIDTIRFLPSSLENRTEQKQKTY